MPKIPFQKPALNIQDQVNLLSQRHMGIEDNNAALHYIKFIGYYRMSGYFRYFTHDNPHEIFDENVTFKDVLNLYIFDRKLRVLLFDALERIEVAFKASVSNNSSYNYGPFWMSDENLFDYAKYGTVSKIIRDSIFKNENNVHVFLDHFFNKYSDPYPPSWMIMEVLSFGAISKIYKYSKGVLRLPVSKEFKLQHDVLESWIHSLVFTRNMCAHYSRVWNRKFTITPKIPRVYRNVWPESAKNRLYVICCIINHMMSVLADGSTWRYRLRYLIRNRPDVPLNSMGFPDDWERSQFWDFSENP